MFACLRSTFLYCNLETAFLNAKYRVPPIDEIFKINKAGIGEKLTAGYYVEINKELYTENVKLARGRKCFYKAPHLTCFNVQIFYELASNFSPKEILVTLLYIFFETLFPNNDTVFTYLVNMKQDKSGLWGMINNYIAVCYLALLHLYQQADSSDNRRLGLRRLCRARFSYQNLKSFECS